MSAQEETLFIDVTVWDRQAETVCCQYLRKGSGVHVEGALKMDTWDDKTTGEKRTKVKVQAERVQFLDRREDSSYGSAPAGDDEAASPLPAARPAMYAGRAGGGPPPRGGRARRPLRPSPIPKDRRYPVLI